MTAESRAIGLAFPANEGGETEGLSDAGVETFRRMPFAAVARETGQNSRDARAGEAPALLKFEQLLIPAKSIPSFEEYRDVVARCALIAAKEKNEKEIEFFNQAQKVLDLSHIPVLKISDFNTRGLVGPCEDGTPFHALLKSTGVSSKDTETSGGSFGIGKNAVYAASDLQTVFYSTIYLDDKQSKKFLCQGKTRLRSFVDNAGTTRRSAGYWGFAEKYLPVSDPVAVPDWLRRDEIGTTIFAIAMRTSGDWEREIISSIIQNFFCAIHRNEMSFEVGDVVISSQTLLKLFFDSKIEQAAQHQGNTEDFEFARSMYDCLRLDDEAKEEVVSIKNVGQFRVRILLRDGLPKRVGIIRNGMLITDNLGDFGHRFQKFPMYSDFVAVVEPDGDAENKWFRRMEDPSHSNLSPERFANDLKRDEARKAGARLGTQIRDAIKAVAKSENQDEVELDELSEFFALDNKATEDPEGIEDPGNSTIRTIPVPQRERTKKPSKKRKEDGDGGDDGDGGEDGESGDGGDGGDGAQPRPKNVGKNNAPIQLKDLRTILPDPGNHKLRRIYFTPSQDGTATLTIEASGLSIPEELKIEGGQIEISCKANTRQHVDVEFDVTYDGPIEITSSTTTGIEK